MKKYLLSFLCILILLLTVGSATYADGITEIRTRADLEAIQNNTSGNYVLKADIDLSGAPWTPIPYFTGTLDGQGHSITGMTINESNPTVNDFGLFGMLDGALITNVNLVDISVSVSSSRYVSVSIIGTPSNLHNFDANTDAYCIYNCHVDGAITVNAADSNDWISAFALACAEHSSADVDLTVNANNYNSGLIWNCSSCTVEGNMTVTAGNGAAAMILDSVGCKSTGDLTVICPDGSCNLHASGVLSLNSVSSDCIGEGKVEHAGRATLLSGCDACEYTGSLISDNGMMMSNCRDCTANCQASNYGYADNVYFRIIDDSAQDRGGNVSYGTLSRGAAVSGRFEVKSYLGKGSTDHVDINLRDNAGAGSVYYEAGPVYGEDIYYPYRTGALYLSTQSGDITAWTTMVNTGAITCVSDTGGINITGGVYNTGNITLRSGGNIEAVGATYYNEGNINVTCTEGTAYIKGIDCSIFGNKIDGAVNRGNITLNSSSKGRAGAVGVINGENAFNYGAVTINASIASKADAMGIADCSQSYNYADITVECSNGSAYAVGVDGSGCINFGNIRAVGVAREGIGACGYQTENGINYSTGSVYAENNYAGLSLDTWGAYAQATNTVGHATAISHHVAVANGGTTYASSSDYGLSASNGQIGWYLAWHNCSCDYGKTKRIVTDGTNPSDSLHTWLRRCDASLMHAEVPPAPEAPEVELPDGPDDNSDISAAIDLYSCVTDTKINSFVNTFGSFSWDEGEDENGKKVDDFSRLELFLQLYNHGSEPKSVKFNILLPDGFSFSPTSIVRSLSEPIECTVTAESPYLLSGCMIYPLYSRVTTEKMSIRLTGAVRQSFDYPVTLYENPVIKMRPTSLVNKHANDILNLPFKLNLHDDDINIPRFDAENYFIKNSSDHYHKELAVLGCTLSQAVYNRNHHENEDDSYITTSFHNLGFTDVVFEQNLSAYDVAVGFAKKKVVSNGEIYNVVMVVIRGTVDLEWVGNFDVLGVDDDVHNNFAQSAQSVYQRYISYTQTHNISKDGHTKVFICGHSRGGAVADIVAETFNITYMKQNVYTYTFAAPNSTRNPVAYNNIYNFVYKYDFVGFVPQGYGKHGISFVVGGKNESTCPEPVGTAFTQYTNGNIFKNVGSQLVIDIIVYENERLNKRVDYYHQLIGLLVSDPNTVADNFIAKSHCGENYCAWVIHTGVQNTIPYDSYVEEVRQNVALWEKGLASWVETAIKHPLLFQALPPLYINNVVSSLAFGYLIKNVPRLEKEKGVKLMSISCPVDVMVKNEYGDIEAVNEGHEGMTITDDIVVFGDGVNTCIVIDEGREYDLSITGTDDGSMSVLTCFTQDGQHVASADLIGGIPVTNGEQFSIHVVSSHIGGLLITSSDGTAYRTDFSQADSVPITEEYFTDAVFRQYLSETWDADKNGVLSAEEISHIESINFSSYPDCTANIETLKGIEYFSGLKWLNAPGMAKLSGMLDLSHNSLLESINVANSRLLTDIQFSYHPYLRQLWCERIGGISGLDFSAFPALEDVNIDQLWLHTLDLSHNEHLKILRCPSNGLTELDLSHNPELVFLACNHNQRLTSLDLSHTPDLEGLNIFNTGITEIDLSHTPKLRVLSAQNTAIAELDISPCPSLLALLTHSEYFTEKDDGYLYEVGTGNYDDRLYYSKTTTLKTPGSVAIDAAHFPDPVFREYISETWDENENDILDAEEIERAEHITLSIYDTWVEEGYVSQEVANYVIEHWQNRIASIDGVQYFTHLRRLDAFDMPLMSGELDFRNATHLESINVWNSGLTEINLGNLPELNSIHCEDNSLGSLDVSGCPSLRDIHAMNDGLKALDVSKNPLLEELWCYENNLSELNIGNNPLITELGCDANHLTELIVSHLSNLRYLNAGDNALTEIDVSGLSKLEDLYLYNNGLTELDVSGCTSLKQLSCHSNHEMATLNLGSISNLEYLFVYCTALTDIDLSNCSKLCGITTFTPYANPINVLDVSKCPVLLELISEENYYEFESFGVGGAGYSKRINNADHFIEFNKGTLLKTAAGQSFSIFTLPDSLTEIEAEAFAGITADKVIVPNRCHIASRAFANCPNLKIVSVTADTVIEDGAFSGSDNVYVLRRGN